MARVGAIPKLDKETSATILKYVGAGMPYRYAAESAGISERSLHRWFARGRKETKGIYCQFWQAIKKARSDAMLRNVAIIQTAAQKTWQAAAWWLERQFPDEFANDSRTVRELKKMIDRLTAK